ncbi:MAG: hypothetical protein QMC79_03825 [Anaerosomatales bacterium]|nr:hypothetical protein [Anaerosomatales bacterium]
MTDQRTLPVMRSASVLALACALLLPGVAHGAAARESTVIELTTLEVADGTQVTFSGEVVSEALRDGEDRVWLNVLDEGVAIGVNMPAEMAEKVSVFGDHRNDGDVVRVTGVYNEACRTHGGDMDVHAETVDVLEQGGERTLEPQAWKGVVGLLGLVAAFIGSRRLRRMRETV